MRWLTRVILVPFVVIVFLLRSIDSIFARRCRSFTATPAQSLAPLREGMMLGVLLAAVVSLLVLLFAEPLGVSVGALPWVAALPTLGGYVGAAVGFHHGGHEPDRADEG